MRKKVKCFILGISLMISIAFTQVSPVLAAGSAEPDGRTVRVAVGINNALYLNDKGKPEGYCANYLQQIAWIEGWNLEYVEGSWNESVQNLYNGTIDLLFPTQHTQDREGKMAFSNYIAGYQPIGLYARDSEDIYFNDYANMNNMRIAISYDTSNSEELENFEKEHSLTYTAIEYNTSQEKIDALNNGDVDLIAFSTFNNVPGGKVVAVLNYLPFYYCTNIQDTELMNELNDGMRQVMVSYPELVGEQYTNVLESCGLSTFTREEHEAIHKKDRLVAGVYVDSLPLAGVDQDGNQIGIYIDLLKKLQEKSGIIIEIKMIDRSDNIYDELNDGTIDFVMGTNNLAYIATDTSTILTSDSIMDYTTAAISKSDYKLEKDGTPVFALTNARKYLTSYINENYPNATIDFYLNTKECLLAVQNGKADATYINSWEYNYQSKNARFENLIEWENSRMHQNIVVGTKNTMDQDILSVIDKAFNMISQEEKDAIVSTNVNMTYVSYTMGDRLYSMRRTFISIAVIVLILSMCFIVYAFMKKQNEKQLVKKNGELETANNAKSVFLSRMSHELRTPLNAMMGYTSLMKQNISSEKLDTELLLQNLAYSERASKYLLKIISDILDIQSVETGKIKLVKEIIDVETYMKNVVDIIQKEAQEKKIDFSYDRLTHFHEAYRLDGVRFQQVLLNVLHNAIKFTPSSGSVRMTAGTIRQEEQNSTLQFVISDTGIGMSQEFIDKKLFQNFAQEYQGISSPYEGCGTGMAISKQIIDLMDGTITCESKKDIGTTFTITITVEHIKSQRNKRREKKEQPTYDLNGIRVLICEDNKLNQDVEKRLLERMKCEVEIAEDGAIGVEMFAQSDVNYYSIILMDIRMPNMDGVEATKHIRSLERSDAEKIPIVAVSANAFDEDIKMSLEAGMNEHLAKPVSGKMLYEKITQYCIAEKTN